MIPSIEFFFFFNFLLKTVFIDFGKWVWLFEYFFHYRLFETFPYYLEFLKINKNVLFSFKFANIQFSENNTDVKIIGKTNEYDQCAHGYPNVLLH